MHIQTSEGIRNVASQGVGGAGLGLGIAGTALGLLNGGLGFLGLGGNVRTGCNCNCGGYDTSLISSLFASLGMERAEKYADGVGLGVYGSLVADYKELRNFIADLDKKVAVEGQATRDNFAFLNNEIHNTKKEIYGYVNSHFVQGKLVMPLDAIEPEAMRRYNTWTPPTTSAEETPAGT